MGYSQGALNGASLRLNSGQTVTKVSTDLSATDTSSHSNLPSGKAVNDRIRSIANTLATLSQLNSFIATVDTSGTRRDFQTTSSTTINADTLYFTGGGINEQLTITAEVLAHKTSGGGAYHAKKHVTFTLVGSTFYPSVPTIISDQPDEYIPESSTLSTYTFTIIRSGSLIIVQVTSETGTINGSLYLETKRLKL